MVDLEALRTTQAVAALIGLAALLLFESAHPFFDLSGTAATGDDTSRGTSCWAPSTSALVAAVFAGLCVTAAVWPQERGIGLLHVPGLPG